MDSIGASGPVRFLVDTGANVSTLSRTDAIRLQIDYRRFGSQRPKPVIGTGGAQSPAYSTKAGISLPHYDRGESLSFSILMAVAQRGPRIPEADYSVLGRDVLNEIRLVVHRRSSILTLE